MSACRDPLFCARCQPAASDLARAARIGVLLFLSTFVGCGDDDDGMPGGSSGGSVASDAGRPRGGSGASGTSGKGSASGTGGQGGGSGMPAMWDGTCEPDPRDTNPDHEECLTCLARECCGRVHGCQASPSRQEDGGRWAASQTCYDPFFSCFVECFDQQDAQSMEAAQRVDECGTQCLPGDVFDRSRRDHIACVLGGIGSEDADGGASDQNCIEACLAETL
jgi:hypothetical protein